MSRRELREQIFKLLFRVEFNSPEDMAEQEELFFEQEDAAQEKTPIIFRTNSIRFPKGSRNWTVC